MSEDPWMSLKPLTAARIALGRCGGSLPTREVLDFAAAHARARDAVWSEFDMHGLATRLCEAGQTVLCIESSCRTRAEYLQRPDLGREISNLTRDLIRHMGQNQGPFDLAVVVSDGLSALAPQRHVFPVLSKLLPRLEENGWRLSQTIIVRWGRVAVADEVGELLGAQLSLILLGERPGLGAPDSLGAYLTFAPRRGRTDAERNCVSNIRPEGLTPDDAAATLHYLLSEARRRRISGVALKDERRVAPRLECGAGSELSLE
ncbi:MAG: ethanolamine ammonia-lyase subunit EutC [Planctomycetales bacterium]